MLERVPTVQVSVPQRKGLYEAKVIGGTSQPPAGWNRWNCLPCLISSPQRGCKRGGGEVTRTRPFLYIMFTGLSVEECAEKIKQLQGCMVCLDWTGNHKVIIFQEKEKANRPGKCTTVVPDGQQCTEPHNKLLHGSKVSSFNILHAIYSS